MATRNFIIRTYFATLDSKQLIHTGIGTHDPVPAQAFIHCLGDAAGSLAIFFLDPSRGVANTDPDGWPNRSEITAARVRGEIFTSVDQYVWYIDMLRNESPVSAVIDDTSAYRNRIWCKEPAGDGEFLTRL